MPLRIIYNPWNIYYVRNRIIDGKYDIAHVHLFPAQYWASIASKLIFKSKTKLITTEHSTSNRRRRKNYLRFLDKLIYHSYDRIISISADAQNNLLECLKSRHSNLHKFTVINNGININKFKQAEPYEKREINYVFDEDTKLLCMVGSFSEAKDQNTIIKAMARLPVNVNLLLVGKGPLKTSSERLAKEMSVENRIHFLGLRTNVERLLKTCDIIIQSSNWEGFGLAAVEGMAAGKPIIASDVHGLSRIVKGAGILFEKGNSIELANQIDTMFKYDNNISTLLSKKSIKRANLYNIENMAKDYIELYRNI